MSASCSFIAENPKKASCKSLDSRTGDQDRRKKLETRTTKCLSLEECLYIEQILDNSLDKTLSKLDNVLEKKNNDDEITEDDTDNLEATKKWTIQQKLSFANKKYGDLK